ncbi:MAG: nickel pincer cofactor biosynthesis protein LarC [Eubacteriales bacterium]|nr:nickel pincer cofactor biosynthesis protein LarC [Eubacteriales bacterium]
MDTLYLECYSGISGDMLVGALLDLGASFERLKGELGLLPLDGYELSFGYEQKCGVRSGAFRVLLKAPEDHVHEGHLHENHIHEDHTHGDHDHGTHVHKGHNHGAHEHRHYSDIREMIEKSGISERVKEMSLEIFRVLAEAEAKVHGKTVDEVAFHEVGAVDSIVDIVGTAICLDDLGITKILVSPMYEGKGHTWCQHGKIPVPVPAVLELVQKFGLPLVISDAKGEMITPTGAAVVAALADLEDRPENYQICKVGIGCGEKDFPHANILRAMLMKPWGVRIPRRETQEPGTYKPEIHKSGGGVWILETNVDDSTGEQIGYAIERLLGAGAKDACAMPLYMKKHRPAYMLQVICSEEQIQEMEAVIFRETTSIGLRKYKAERAVLERRMEELDTPYGQVKIKCCTHGQAEYCYPEYESLKKIALEKNLPYAEVFMEVQKIIENR